MKTPLPLLGFFLAALPLLASPPHPSVLTVKYKDQMLPVVRVKGDNPVVMVNGKEKTIRDFPKYEIVAADDFADNFVESPRRTLGGMQRRDEDTSRGLNRYTDPHVEFDLKLTLTARTSIKRGFITVATDSRHMFIRELPELPANKPVTVKLSELRNPPSEYMRPDIFCQIFDDNGHEVLTTDVDFAWSYFERAEQIRLMNAGIDYLKKNKGQDHPATPFVTPRPLLDHEATPPLGEISAAITIAANGTVSAVEIGTIDDAHVRNIAVSTLLGWLYLPELKAGTPVESHLTVPLRFSIARIIPPSPN